VAEQSTPAERLLRFIPVPYAVACGLFAAITTFPVQFLAAYADTLSLDESFRLTFNYTNELDPTPGIASQVLWSSSLGFVLYMVRLLRLRLLQSEADMLPISKDGEAGIRRSFGSVSRWRPPLLMTILITTVALLLILPAYVQPGMFSIAYWLVGLPLQSFVLCSFLWEYFAKLRGLHRFGRGSLRLQPYYEDGMFGTKALGALSLRLFVVFFAFMGMNLVSTIFTPVPTTAVALTSVAFFAIPIAIGVPILLLPLNSVHQEMLREKKRLQSSIRKSLLSLAEQHGNPGDTGEALKAMATIMSLQARKHEVDRLPSWPFDTAVLGRIAAIILSVTAILISRFITAGLHL
jgi:hypothetical protein